MDVHVWQVRALEESGRRAERWTQQLTDEKASLQEQLAAAAARLDECQARTSVPLLWIDGVNPNPNPGLHPILDECQARLAASCVGYGPFLIWQLPHLATSSHGRRASPPPTSSDPS